MNSKLVSSLAALVLLLAACGGDEADKAAGSVSDGGSESVEATDTESAAESDSDSEEDTDPAAQEETPVESTPPAIEPGTVVRLLTHDSFAVSDGLFDEFTFETGIDVEVIQAGDAGELVARSVLNVDQPEGDVLFGIDNTFLQRGLDAGLFLPYESPGLATVPDDLQLDSEFRVTPIDVGDVCINYWTDELDQIPASMDDLTDPALAANFVTQNPETSSPGFAFLLATIARYGEDGWEEYWQQLADGGVTVTPGWTDSYYGDFIAGGGDKALVTSYASSPVAEVVFATEAIDTAPTGILEDSCFRQIEFAGVLAGTEVQPAAETLIDFMLSTTFQEDIPLTMFVAPASSEAVIPESYAAHAVEVSDPLTLSPAEIEANRNDWTERWAEIVLR